MPDVVIGEPCHVVAAATADRVDGVAEFAQSPHHGATAQEVTETIAMAALFGGAPGMGKAMQLAAEVIGWCRFRDGTAPDVMSLPLFADAFPPTVFTRLGPIGWVPTLELTVHIRRRPAPGWLACQVWTDDIHNGKLIESVRLWDSTGELVAQGRQLGLLI